MSDGFWFTSHLRHWFRAQVPQPAANVGNADSSNGCMQSSHLPNNILELPCVLFHPSLPNSLKVTAQLLAISKAVAAAAKAARSSLLQKLELEITSSSGAQQTAAWLGKNSDLLHDVRTLQLQLARDAIDGHSQRCSSIGQSTISAAAILRSMPRSLESVDLDLLLGDEDLTGTLLHDCECAVLRSELAALPNLQSISIQGRGAAACLPYSRDLATTFSQLTSMYLSSIRSQAGLEQLLPVLPASLVQLGLGMDLPKRLILGAELSDSDRQWLLQLQRGVQMAQLTALTSLTVNGNSLIIGEDSQLPPNLVSLRAPMVMHERPLLQLARLQHLDIHSFSTLGAAGLAGIARCLTQLTSVMAGWVQIEDDDAPQVIAALAALPLKSLGVLSYGPPGPAAAADASSPAAVGGLLGQLTGLKRLEIATGAYRVADVVASLAHLTGLEQLELSTTESKRVMLRGHVARYEALADAIVALKQLRNLRASAHWFDPAAAEGDWPHPIMCLQAATQLTYLSLSCLKYIGSFDVRVRQPDWELLLQSLPEVQLGQELTKVQAKLRGARMAMDRCRDAGLIT